MSSNKGFTLWLRDCGAGKTPLAHTCYKLRARGIGIEVLDGDEVRTNLSRARLLEEDATQIFDVSVCLSSASRNGVVTVAAAISPYREVREEVRRAIERGGVEFTKSLSDARLSARERDVKGLYKRALAGEVKEFTGVSDPYEEPLTPDIVVETDRESANFSASKIIRQLERRGLIPAAVLSKPEIEVLSQRHTREAKI